MARVQHRRTADYISRCVKYSLFFFNFLFWLVSGCLVAIGGWSFLEEYNYKGLPAINNAFELFVRISIIVMVLGGVVFIISFAGCLGALRENTCLLKFYSYILLLLFLGEMALAIFAFVFPNQFIDIIQQGLSKELTVKYRDDANLQNVIDGFQKEFQCCGMSDKGYKDWSKNIYFNCSIHNKSPERCAVPYSCCRDPHNIDNGLVKYDVWLPHAEFFSKFISFVLVMFIYVKDANEKIYTRGCIEAIQEYVQRNLNLVAGIFLAVSFVQLFAMYLCRTLLAQISMQRAQWT